MLKFLCLNESVYDLSVDMVVAWVSIEDLHHDGGPISKCRHAGTCPLCAGLEYSAQLLDEEGDSALQSSQL